jgi:hypothetical protein
MRQRVDRQQFEHMLLKERSDDYVSKNDTFLLSLDSPSSLCLNTNSIIRLLRKDDRSFACR